MLVRSRDADSEIHLDFVPMVDVLFNLLIFFLLATTLAQVEREMRIALPAAVSAGPISAALREVVINVDAKGQCFVGGQAIEPTSLQTMLTDAVKVNPEQKATVRGDRAAAYAHVVKVLDICKSAGIQQPYLDTVLED